MINTRIRPAVGADAPQMVLLLNSIIVAGGTTAHQTLFDDARMLTHYIARPSNVTCQVAITNGRLSGFQSLNWATDPTDPMPKGWAAIASFVAADKSGLGIGKKLFSATRHAAKAAGVHTIDATIRADNQAGLRYYSGLGFVDYDTLTDVPLSDGTRVSRIRKQLAL